MYVLIHIPTYLPINKVLEKVQTDLCFEKPKFHLKIWKQNLGQNLKKGISNYHMLLCR